MLGHEVLLVDRDTELTGPEAAAAADVVVIAVNIESTVEVIKTIGPACRPDALLMDLTSIKQAPVDAMLDSCDCTVIGTHPLFGPTLHSLQGQPWCSRRPVPSAIPIGRPVDQHALGRGPDAAGQHAGSPRSAMAVVQVLTHYSTEVLGRTMQRLDVSVEETLHFTSPIYPWNC